MVAFTYWSHFGSFKDPLGISQTVTFPIPPKTTVGGILGAMIGKKPEEIFGDLEYFNFQYSVIPLSPIRKKSFAQNYIDDFTKTSGTKLDEMQKFAKQNPKSKFLEIHQRGFKKGAKPIYRELLIAPKYLIVIQDFKFKDELETQLKNHNSVYPLYMGNSEFSANFEYVDAISKEVRSSTVDSFTASLDLIDFEEGQHYSSLKMATKSFNQREYSDYTHLVVSNKALKLKQEINALHVKTKFGEFVCECL